MVLVVWLAFPENGMIGMNGTPDGELLGVALLAPPNRPDENGPKFDGVDVPGLDAPALPVCPDPFRNGVAVGKLPDAAARPVVETVEPFDESDGLFVLFEPLKDGGAIG